MIHLPELLPDEFLLGYMGRIARCNGLNRVMAWKLVNARADSLTGSNALRSATHTLAAVLRTNPDDLAGRHTALPVVRALRKPGTSLHHADLSCARTLRLFEFRLQDKSPYLCRSCVEEDLKFWGISYWRRMHQVRGVLVCAKHGELLELAPQSSKLDLFPEECRNGTRRRQGFKLDAITDRYRQVVEGMLELRQALPADQVAYRLLARCDADRSSWHCNTKRAPLWQQVQSVLRGSYLDRVFPPQCAYRKLRHKGKSKPEKQEWDIYGSGYSLALALAAMYPSADAALLDILKPLSRSERSKANTLLPPKQLAYLNY